MSYGECLTVAVTIGLTAEKPCSRAHEPLTARQLREKERYEFIKPIGSLFAVSWNLEMPMSFGRGILWQVKFVYV